MLGLSNPIHIAFLLLIVLMVFGAKRLPEMGRSLGSGLRGFKDTLTDEPEQVEQLVAATGPAGDSAAHGHEARVIHPAAIGE